ncbi:MAG: discoidin domain-containing protein, partial [Abitibacteriaceae bacterium]|nr:discoidin domain-containing protein [Abditibacteriaceae bacterium]
MKKSIYLTAYCFTVWFLGLLVMTGANAASAILAKMTPDWPRSTVARQQFNFNQGWRFLLPPTPVPPPPFVPAQKDRIQTGTFAPGKQVQNVMLGEHASRFVVLESLSSQNGTPFASVAEFWLLDAQGNPLPRQGWHATADSEEPGANDFAANAIDGDPATKWHSRWLSAQPEQPHRLIIDTGRLTRFAGFRVLPRSDGNNGSNIKDWRFYATNAGPPQPAASTLDVAHINDANWERVNLPHTVRLEPLNAAGGRNYQGICWYRKHFPVANAWQNHKLYLVFEGAMHTADLWLNGIALPSHYGGYTQFTVDISQAVRFGRDNVLTLRLDNSDNPEVPPGKPQNTLD